MNPQIPIRQSTRAGLLAVALGAVTLFLAPTVQAAVVFETVSPYHHIRVIDQGGVRILSFNGSQETRMSIANPLQGHFEYTEFFHLPWIWNPNIERVAMIGLGGGSIQRAYQNAYPQVHIDSVDIDPEVVRIAERFFHVRESSTHNIHVQDGRLFLRRARDNYDVILVDAYTTGRYGPAIPPHLTTREFFQIASDRLSDNGVFMFNAIGSLAGRRPDMIGALHNTMRDVFPQVYIVPARTSINVVFLATKYPERYDARRLLHEAQASMRDGTVRLPTFIQRVQSVLFTPPPTAAFSPILTDGHAPVEGLMSVTPHPRPASRDAAEPPPRRSR